MLYPHSLLWHYLWVGPHVLQLMLAILLWRRGFQKQFPAFFTYIVYEAIKELTLWLIDWLPGISAQTWWRACFAGMAIEGLLKFAFALELFHHLVRSRESVAKAGKRLLVCTIAALVALAAWAASHAHITVEFPLASYTHTLGQTIYLIQCGLLLFLFLFTAHYRLAWSRWGFGIALGSAVSTCVHLATWAMFANLGYLGRGYLLDFLNTGTYHVCVLVWFYYLIRPVGPSASPNVAVIPGTQQDTAPPTFRRLWHSRLLWGVDS
jgi:hypothetical protein